MITIFRLIWTQFKKGDFKSMEEVGKYGAYHLWLSANSKSLEKTDENEQQADLRAVFAESDHKPSVYELQQALLSLQRQYDKSKEVNSFLLDGRKNWVDKATRVGLMNSLNVLESVGEENYTVWLNNKPYALPVNFLKQFLMNLELYAMQCYAVTEKHCQEIMALDSVEKLLEYDVTAGYPDMIVLKSEDLL